MTKLNKQMAPLPGRDEEDVLSSVDTVSSSMECTGLIQTPPTTEAEAESYADLYTIPKPTEKADGDTGNNRSEGTPREPRKKRSESKR